jgi:spore coat protein U-like protein
VEDCVLVRRVALLIAALGALPAMALADSVSATVAVQAAVIPNCRIAVADLQFGAYDPLGRNAAAHLDATSRVVVTCTKGTPLTVSLAARQQGESQGAREMVRGESRLAYELYRNPAHTQAWGSDAASGVNVLAARGVRAPEELVIYGRVLAGQPVLAGQYEDTIVAHVEF